MTQGRRSTGRVKLKEAYGVLSLIVPKKQHNETRQFLGDTFICEVGHDYIDDLIIFRRIKPAKMQLRLKK